MAVEFGYIALWKSHAFSAQGEEHLHHPTLKLKGKAGVNNAHLWPRLHEDSTANSMRQITVVLAALATTRVRAKCEIMRSFAIAIRLELVDLMRFTANTNYCERDPWFPPDEMLPCEAETV